MIHSLHPVLILNHCVELHSSHEKINQCLASHHEGRVRLVIDLRPTLFARQYYVMVMSSIVTRRRSASLDVARRSIHVTALRVRWVVRM